VLELYAPNEGVDETKSMPDGSRLETWTPEPANGPLSERVEVTITNSPTLGVGMSTDWARARSALRTMAIEARVLAADRSGPADCPVKVVVAWLVMAVPFGVAAFTRTWKRTVDVVPTAAVPPVVAFAPIPRRKAMRLFAASYSAWSSPEASDLVPALVPETICSDPGT
jgi:hypothetical protein